MGGAQPQPPTPHPLEEDPRRGRYLGQRLRQLLRLRHCRHRFVSVLSRNSCAVGGVGQGGAVADNEVEDRSAAGRVRPQRDAPVSHNLVDVRGFVVRTTEPRGEQTPPGGARAGRCFRGVYPTLVV